MTFEFDLSMDTVQNILRRRGLTLHSQGDKFKVLYPYKQLIPPTTAENRHRLSAAHEPYFEHFGRLGFRKLIGRLIVAGSDGLSQNTVQSIAGRRSADYIRFLVNELEIAKDNQRRIVLESDIADLGPSLEHYVSQVCEKVLKGRAIWGVQLSGLPSGGDFDVLAWLAPKLLYVECKSGRPENISDKELGAFLTRTRELGSDVSIILVDTDNDIAAVVERLNNEIEPLYQTNEDVREAYPLARTGVSFRIDFSSLRVQPSDSYPSIYFGYQRVYAINSKPSIPTQIDRCLAHHHSHMKQMDLLIAKSFGA